MSKKKRIITEEEEEPEVIRPEDGPTADEIETLEKLENFQAQFTGKNYKVRVEKWHETDNEFEWCGRYNLDGFDPFSVLSKNFGGGKYRLVLLDNGGKFVKGGMQSVRIARSEVPVEKPGPVSPLQDPTVALLLESAKSQTNMLVELFKATLSKPLPEQTGVSQLIEGLKNLKALVPESKDGGTKGIRETFEILKTAKDLINDSTELSGKDKTGVLAELSQALKVAQDMGIMGPRRPVGPGSVAAPAVVPVGPPVLPTVGGTVSPQGVSMPVETKPDPLESLGLVHIPIILEGASKNEPIEKWAEYVAARLEQELVPVLEKKYIFVSRDTILDGLLSAIEKPDMIDKIVEYAPGFKDYQPWVREVLNGVSKQFVETSTEPEVEVDPANLEKAGNQGE